MNRLLILVVLLGIIYCIHLYQQKLDRRNQLTQISNNRNVRERRNPTEDTYTIDEFAFDNMSLMSTGSLDDIRKDVNRLKKSNQQFDDSDTIMFSDIIPDKIQ